MIHPTTQPAPFSAVAVYRGPSGRTSTYPVRAGCEPPPSITAVTGEVRHLESVEHVTVTRRDAERVA